MKVSSSLWFWLLIFGVFLILVAALLAGGLKETNGWIWGIFIVGAVLSLLGIILAIIVWSKPVSCNTDIPKIIVESEKKEIYSPIGTPTRVSTNIPQTQRGFGTTNFSISTLSPDL